MTEIAFYLGKNDAATYREIAPPAPVDKQELAKLLVDWAKRELEKNDVRAQ
jgi:hypothetical protein